MPRGNYAEPEAKMQRPDVTGKGTAELFSGTCQGFSRGQRRASSKVNLSSYAVLVAEHFRALLVTPAPVNSSQRLSDFSGRNCHV